MQKLRDKLINKDILAEISSIFDLPNQVICNEADRLAIVLSDKNSAEMFEAYIGGFFYSLGGHGKAYEAVESWLHEVFTPLAHMFCDPTDMAEAEEDMLAVWKKAMLHTLWSQRHLDVPYTNVAILPEDAKGDMGKRWTVTCIAKDKKGGVW